MVKQVKKRNEDIIDFLPSKIENAVSKAFVEVYGEITEESSSVAHTIARIIEDENKDIMSVEEIQDKVEELLMQFKKFQVARAYIKYRYERKRIRNTTDKDIFELISGENDYWNNENSNKNPMRATVQRDYIAGISSTDITKRCLLPEDIVKAHDEGVIHFHDADYYLQDITNCCLINLDDMLQNGTVVNGIMIEKPHSFRTACTIATQIITAVTSSQYGGTTISLTHLAPFVRISYKKYLSKHIKRGFEYEECCRFATEDLKDEIKDGVQTFNYQINSMQTTNGQSPFISVFMYLGETEEYKDELAMIIEEFLKQRITGMKNEVGAYVTPAFPKLLYVLEESNINEDSKYYYLTQLSAISTAKRMNPDYISEKIMKELKENNVFPCIKFCA